MCHTSVRSFTWTMMNNKNLLVIVLLKLLPSGYNEVASGVSPMDQMEESNCSSTVLLCDKGSSETLLLNYGIRNSNELVPQLLNTSSSPINLTTPFLYFGKNETVLYVNTHGILSFGTPYVVPSPKPFTTVSTAVVAIYWANGNVSHSGSISYGIVEKMEDVEYIQGLVSSAFDLGSFEPKLIFVATYADIPQTYNTSNNLTNTFQAVLVTDGELSFILFSYKLIEWPLCCGVNDYPNVGFNSGDKSFTLPSALTHDVLHIENGTNVGIEGLYMYRVDQDTVQEPTNCGAACSYWRYTNENNVMCQDREPLSGSGIEGQESTLTGANVSIISSKPVPVLLGDYVTLTCSVNGNQILGYTYSWSHNGTDLPDETTPTLILAGVQTSDVGMYQCTITDGCDSISDTLVLQSKAILQKEAYSFRLSPHCNSEETRDTIILDVLQLLTSDFEFQPLGRVKVFPAASCEEIRQTQFLFKPGLYWIAENGMDPTQIHCNV